MASVSSLDADMKRLRMSRYTPGAAKEIRAWIEDTLGEQLPNGDLLDILKDGTILCRLVSLGLPPPGLKYKKSPAPFIQMENISHFLRACESPPFNLPSHDRFLTVDLYEQKDPAQVIQCLGAFSRVANALFPQKFRTTIGPKRAAMSPTHTGASNGSAASDNSSSQNRNRGMGITNQPIAAPLVAQSSGNRPTSTTYGGPSSILYAGYMGGASQGNQGISFGSRRQITTPAPYVPSLAEKERKRKEKEQEDARLRILAEEAESKRKVEREAEEERAKIAEERRWEEETRQKREEEKRRVEQQKKEWEEQERQWKQDEEARLREESEAQSRAEKEKHRRRGLSDPRLRGQYLSEYQAEQKTSKSRQVSYNDPERAAERDKILDLERQLEEAKEREKQYEEERRSRDAPGENKESAQKARSRSRSRPRPLAVPEENDLEDRPISPPESEASWKGDEREYLRKQHQQFSSPRPLPDPKAVPRPLPQQPNSPPAATSTRPLPDPITYQPGTNRTDRFLSSNPAPQVIPARTNYPVEMGLTSESERAAEDARRMASQKKTKAGGWASKSLLEREMERERERQREWEASQQETSKASRDGEEGSNPGQTWDVNQYGYMGGDSQNRVGAGIGFGGRRQIIGPRPPPS